MAKLRIFVVLITGIMLLMAWSPVFTGAAPPSGLFKPTNLTPENATTDITLTPTLTCRYSHPDNVTQLAAWWQIRKAGGSYADPVFDTGIVIETESLVSLEIPAGYLLPSTETVNMTYYWRVKHQDANGWWSEWSDETCFTTFRVGGNVRPTTPVNVAPVNGAVDVTPELTLRASPFQSPLGLNHGASRWQVRSGDPGSSYDYPLYDSGITAGSTQLALPVEIMRYGKTYYWRVKYQDEVGVWSEWSSETSFRVVGNLKPDTPINLEPVDGAVAVAVTPLLKASNFSDPNMSGYTVLLDTHAASQWQIRAVDGGYSDAVWDSGIANPTTIVLVPEGKLAADKTYYWRVRYQDSYGNWSGWSVETSFVTKALSLPVADFVADKTEMVAGLEYITFTDNSTPAGEITTWYWDFGDGTTENWTTLTRPSGGRIAHKYTTGGSYTVSLKVTNAAGSDTKTEEAYIVVRAKPEARLLAPATARVGASVSFKETSFPSGDITSWRWDFGDGTAVVEWNAAERAAADGKITHIFKKAGRYVVSLRVSGPLGDSVVNKQIDVTGGGGFRFGLWMVGVAVAALVVIAGAVYLLQSRKTAK